MLSRIFFTNIQIFLQVDLLANTSIEVRLKVINTVLSRIERSSLSRINSSPI